MELKVQLRNGEWESIRHSYNDCFNDLLKEAMEYALEEDYTFYGFFNLNGMLVKTLTILASDGELELGIPRIGKGILVDHETLDVVKYNISYVSRTDRIETVYM